MSDTLTLESKQIAEDLYALLQSLDPSRRAADAEIRGRQTLSDLRARLRVVLQARESASRESGSLHHRLFELSRVLEEASPALISPDVTEESSPRAAWNRFRRRAYPVYEALAASLKAQDIHVPSLRPTNYYRNVFHVVSGLLVLLAVQLILTPFSMIVVAGSATVWAWSMEYFRRYNPRLNALLMATFGRMAHPHEHYRVNSATWYATALLLMALSCDKLTASLAVVVLALGDPMAALIGRRFGRIRLVAGRSLEGSMAFIGASALGCWCMQAVFYGMIPPGTAMVLALMAAIPGALAELFSKRIDDNFTIPLATALGATLGRLLLGF